jgi:periplasmic divalent cation tolerance protein
MNTASDIQIILCTVPDTETGRRIAKQLVEYRLAACVNLVAGVESVYYWNGKVHHDPECLLMIKGLQSDYRRLEKTIRELHPYELPEIIAVPLSNGLAEYLEWVRNFKNEAT